MDKLLSQIGKCMIDAAEGAGIFLSEVHGAVFPSFGFCDYVLLFLSKTPETVMAILDHLKEAKVPGQKFPAISSFYPLTGFEPLGLEQIKKSKITNVWISIRVNLQEGVSNRQFQNEIETMNDVPEELKKSKIYHLFGSSDCLVMPDVLFGDCIPLYFNREIFDPQNKVFFQKYICNMRSSIRIGNQNGGAMEPSLAESDEDIENRKKEKEAYIQSYAAEFKKLIEKLEKSADDYRIPIREVYGLQNVMKSFLDLIRSSHCFDLQEVIGKMFGALSKNININLETIEQLHEMGGKEKEKEESIADMWSALGLFRKYVGDYLSDMRRSDRSLIEGHTLVHQSIGSSTKLLLFYNRFVSEVAEKLVESEEDSKEQKYVFLVTSGGSDVTAAHDLFSHLDPTLEGKEDIIVLTIPEMSLYDIRGTMFRLLHECLHFCGERKREERYELVIDAVSAYSAMTFCRFIIKQMEDFLDESVYQNLTHMFPEETLKQVRETWESEIQKEAVKEEQRLKEHIKENFLKNMEMSQEDYYGRYLYEFIELVAVHEVFVPVVPINEKVREDSLFYSLYEAFLRLRISLSSKLTEILRQEPMEIPFSNAQFIENIDREKLDMQKQGKYVIEDQWFIDSFMEYYMGKRTEDRYLRLAETDKIGFSGLVETLKLMFKECYADCMAAIILGADITDIIMGIAYETWDIERAFPATDFEKLRRMVEMDVLYKKPELVEQDMKERIECWLENGYETRACQNENDRDMLFKRVIGNIGKEEHEAYACLLEPVEEYLRICIEKMQEELGKFQYEREIFRYAAFENEGDLQLFLKEMNCSWKKYAGDEKNAGA